MVRISGGYIEEYWTENGIRVSTPDYHEKTDAKLLQCSNAPDVYSTNTRDCDLRALKDTGLLADLSESALLREAVGRMRPEIQALLMDEQGHVCAMPRYVMSEPVYWRQEAWDAGRIDGGGRAAELYGVVGLRRALGEGVCRSAGKRTCALPIHVFSAAVLPTLIPVGSRIF